MKNNKKVIIGYRDKVEIKKSTVLTVGLVLLFVAVLLGSLFLFVKGELVEKIMAVVVECGLSGLIFLLYLAYVKNQNKINSYPDEVIYYEDDCICIAEETTIKIKVSDIKKIKDVWDSVENRNTSGMIIIITKDNKKYKVVQVKNVRDVAIELNDIYSKYLVKEYNEKLIKELEEMIEKARTNDKVKKIEIDDLLFVYDNKLNWFETIATIDNIKVKFIFHEGSEVEQNTSIETIKVIVREFDSFYKKVLKNLADDLIENANDWNNEDDEITKEDFINRIDQKYIEISVTEEDYEIFLDDDGIFLGHTIVYYGNIKEENFSTDIAG